MRKKSPTIFLGDFARAVCKLEVSDPAGLKLIAELLGFSFEPGMEELKPKLPSEPGETFTSTTRLPDIADPDTGQTEGARETKAEEEQLGASIPVEMSQTQGEKETWIPEVEPLPPQNDEPIQTPPLIPLFRPQWTRGILSAALATRADDGLLDIEEVTEILARREQVERLPTVPSRTLERGVQLLLDKSQAMMPFVRDEAWMLKEIRNVIGADKVEVLRFVGSPVRGAGAGPKPWGEYRPPPPGTPVVVLSDLGICQPTLAADWAGEEEWLKFAERARRASCPLIALVPYKASRWPRTLARLMTIVQWDRSTTVATVASLLKSSIGEKFYDA
jgi:hypothetical protein